MTQIVIAKRKRQLRRLGTAITIFEMEGWVQGKMKTVKGYCIIGGLKEACLRDAESEDREDYGACAELIGVVGREVVDYANLALWNDAPGRTKEEVLTVLKKAKEKMEAEEKP